MKTRMIRSGWRHWALVSLMVGLLSAGYPLQQAAAGEGVQAQASDRATHYIVFEKYADGTASPVYYRLVELDAPLVSLTEAGMNEALASPSRNAEQIAVSLQSRDGKVLYQNVIQVSPWLRGEFTGETSNDTIDGHLFPLETISFVVRVPQIEGTTLILANDKLQTVARFDMQQLAVSTPQIELNSSPAANSPGVNVGPASNRVDFLVMGDGYSSAQQTKFNTDVSSTTSTFFSISPYFEYRNYVNLHSLFTASSQSGADHPPYNASCGSNDPTCCPDSAMLSDPLQGTMVNTAFDSRFCTNAIHRLLVPNFSKVLAAAAAVPDWDTILLLVNDSTYGGSGGYISTVSMHSSAAEIAEHEYGHSFVDLADEYESAYPGYPACSDISGSVCESNVTDVTNPAQIKWKAWIEAGTPIPTPNDQFYDGIVGLFEGARYKSTGMYRSGYSCIMRFLGAPYCQVPSQSYVLKLYQGGWGVPANGISLIEPGSNTPANPNINLTHPNTQVFHAGTLSPEGGPPVQITWLKNGVPIPGASGNNYLYTISLGDPALVQITMRVKDTTSLVIPAMAGTTLQNEFTWNVTVSYNAYTISGNTGVAGVTLSYMDGTPKTATSLANGNYSFQVLSGWSGTVTPSKAGYNFSPAGRIYTNITTNLADQNYAAMVNISGDVGVAGATLSYNDGTARTGTSLQDGGYILSLSYNWSGTVTPSHACYTFNPVNRIYNNVIADQTAQNYTPTLKPGCANIVVGIAGTNRGTYGLAAQQSARDSYAGVNAGPVQVVSTNAVPFLVAERDAWLLNGVVQSFSEMMGLPGNQVTDTYYFPWYNNATMDTQLRFANLGAVPTDITVTIAGVPQPIIPLAPGVSTRVSYAGINNGPVKVQSSGGTPIIVAERDAWLVNSVVQSFSEMMGLPANKVTDTYYFPWYNNVTMDTQLRFANLGAVPTNITVTIAGVAKPAITVPAGQSTRVSYPGINNGPVKVQSTGGAPIIVAERDAWLINGVVRSFSEMMGLPGNQLTTTYHFPWYNNVTMDTQLRFANLGAVPTDITVTIAGVAQPVIPLAAGVSTRVSYAGINNGPVTVTSSGGVPILVAERDAWLLNGAVRSFSEMMGLPGNQLTTTYYFPWYNNVTMDTQLRFAVP